MRKGFLLSVCVALPVFLNAYAMAEEGGNPSDPSLMSEECVRYQGIPDADLGDVLRAGCEPTLAQMSALMDNPLGNVAMFINQYDLSVKENPVFDETDVQHMYTAIFQFPKRLNENWNLINRVILTATNLPLDTDAANDGFGNTPGGITPPPDGFPGGGMSPVSRFSGSTSALGDSYYVGLLSPYDPVPMGKGKLVWGLGIDLALPTATDDMAGTEKWMAGPSVLAAYLGPKWKIGGLLMHYEDFAGDDDRADVSMTNLQYFWYYSLSDTFSIGAGPNIIANWEQSGSDRFTVPIGIGFNTTVNIGKVPVRFGAEIHYSAIQPDDVLGTEWNFRFYAIPAAPSALFGWMQ